jgi:hypothetical protein
MVEWFWMTVFYSPSGTRVLGRGIATIGFGLICMGWRGHRILGLFERRLGKLGLETPGSLGELYPKLPTWWIPETAFGFTLAASIMILGFMLARAGRFAQEMSR